MANSDPSATHRGLFCDPDHRNEMQRAALTACRVRQPMCAIRFTALVLRHSLGYIAGFGNSVRLIRADWMPAPTHHGTVQLPHDSMFRCLRVTVRVTLRYVTGLFRARNP